MTFSITDYGSFWVAVVVVWVGLNIFPDMGVMRTTFVHGGISQLDHYWCGGWGVTCGCAYSTWP